MVSRYLSRFFNIDTPVQNSYKNFDIRNAVCRLNLSNVSTRSLLQACNNIIPFSSLQEFESFFTLYLRKYKIYETKTRATRANILASIATTK